MLQMNLKTSPDFFELNEVKPTVSSSLGAVYSETPAVEPEKHGQVYDLARASTSSRTFSFSTSVVKCEPVDADLSNTADVKPSQNHFTSPETSAVLPDTVSSSTAISSPATLIFRCGSISGQEQVPGTSCSNSISTDKNKNNTAPVFIQHRINHHTAQDLRSEIERGFYLQNDMRPPYTYPVLVREAIIRSPNKELKVVEIDQWFRDTFKFFRIGDPKKWMPRVRDVLTKNKSFKKKNGKPGGPWYVIDEKRFESRRQVDRKPDGETLARLAKAMMAVRN